MSRLAILLSISILASFAHAAKEPPVPVPAPIGEIIKDLTGADFTLGFASARSYADNVIGSGGNTQGHTSVNDDEFIHFTGSYQFPTLAAEDIGRYRFGLALFSDDGSSLNISDLPNSILPNTYNAVQPLPETDRSFHIVDHFFDSSQSVDMGVLYSNVYYIEYSEELDIDGCTLFVVKRPYLDIAIATHGDQADLAENQNTAQPPHEMDPGGFVLAPVQTDENEPPQPSVRTRITLKAGHDESFGGHYTLSAGKELSKLRIYPTPEGTEGALTLPHTWTVDQFTAAPQTYYIGSDAFKPEEQAQTGTLTFQYTPPTPTDKENPPIQDEVKVSLLPVEVESMDKFLAGSLDESIIETFGGESSFGLEFRNPSSGESYRFNSIADAYVYDNPYADTEEGEDAFLSDEEVAMSASGSDSEGRLSQDVIFYKQDGKLHFRSIFDQAGEIEIAILKDGEEIGAVTHELVEDEDIGDLIDTIDEVLSDEWGDSGPVILAAQSASFSTEGDEPQFAQARQGGRRGHYRHRNATTKVTMSIWDRIKNNFKEGVRRTTEAATRAIRTAALTGKGFVEGAWMGIKDDAQGLVELVKMVANPTETAKSFYEAFKALMSLDLEGWKNVGLTMVESFLNKGKEGAGEWVQPDNFDVAAYLAGYTSGYIVEQAVITYVTAGGAQALKAGKVGGKIGALVRAAAKRVKPPLKETIDNAMRVAALKAKNSIFRRVSQDVASDADVKKLKSILQELEFECPLLAAP